MEPVYCPNGHPNRPGTRICIVCRALLEPSTPVVTPPRKPAPERPPALPRSTPPPPPQPAEEEAPAPATQPPPARRSRAWLWLLLLLLVLVAPAIVILRSLLFPVSETMGEAPTPVISTEVASAGNDRSATAVPPIPATDTIVPATATAPMTTPTVPTTAVATITPLATVVGVVITPTFAFGPDANFIQNGDFADDWVNGWTRDTDGEPVGEREIIEVRPEADAAGEDALYLEKTGSGSLQLAQRVVLTFPVEALVFRARVQIDGATSGAAEGRAALVLRYEDSEGTPLGASVWLDGSAEETELWGVEPLPPAGPTLAARYLSDGWQAIELALGRELAEELPDVNPVDVRQITVILALLGDGSCAAADCATSLAVSSLSLTAEAP